MRSSDVLTDLDLLPCPWCRSEQIETVVDAWAERGYTVVCWTCFGRSPNADDPQQARQVYLVIARLVQRMYDAVTATQIQNTLLVAAMQTFHAERKAYGP